MPTPPSLSVLLIGAAVLAACSTQPAPHDHGSAAPATAAAPPLFDDLGRYHRPITTRSPKARA